MQRTTTTPINPAVVTPVRLDSFNTKWQVHLDLIDANLMRPCYLGKSWIINPFWGLRAGRIFQHLVFHRKNPDFTAVGQPVTFARSHLEGIIARTQSVAYAIYPRAGFNGQYLLKWDWRLQSNFALSLLYNRYTKISHRETLVDLLTTNSPAIGPRLAHQKLSNSHPRPSFVLVYRVKI